MIRVDKTENLSTAGGDEAPTCAPAGSTNKMLGFVLWEVRLSKWTQVPTIRTQRTYSTGHLTSSKIPQRTAMRRPWRRSGTSWPEFGALPTADSWTARAMVPTERTIRRRFGSFRSALIRAGLP